MFSPCPVCKGWGVNIGILVFRVQACENCGGGKIVDEHTGKPFGWEPADPVAEEETSMFEKLIYGE